MNSPETYLKIIKILQIITRIFWITYGIPKITLDFHGKKMDACTLTGVMDTIYQGHQPHHNLLVLGPQYNTLTGKEQLF